MDDGAWRANEGGDVPDLLGGWYACEEPTLGETGVESHVERGAMRGRLQERTHCACRCVVARDWRGGGSTSFLVRRGKWFGIAGKRGLLLSSLARSPNKRG